MMMSMNTQTIQQGISVYQKQLSNPVEDSEEKFKTSDVAFVKAESLDDLRIKQQIERMKSWESHVKSHELAHILTGGGHISSAGYTYAYGPDGKKYIVGGAVSVSVPGGLNHESIAKLQRLEQAAVAASDHSQQDLISANIISAIKRSRMQKLQLSRAVKAYERTVSQRSRDKLHDGEEIFVYKKMNLRSTRLLELFV